jgi:hypothetical protein
MTRVCPEGLDQANKLKGESTKLLTQRSAFIHDVSPCSRRERAASSGALRRCPLTAHGKARLGAESRARQL